jgi:hypothetical protein
MPWFEIMREWGKERMDGTSVAMEKKMKREGKRGLEHSVL